MNLRIFTTLLLPFFSFATYCQTSGWIWANNAIGNSYDEGENITVDALGNSYVIGEFQSDSIFFEGIALINKDYNRDIFIVKYDPDGNVIWAKRAGGISNDFGYGISLDGRGNLFITGNFNSNSVSFDSIILHQADFSGVFIAKYDTSGNIIWAKSGSGQGASISITNDANGNAYICGIFIGPIITFDSIMLLGNTSTVDGDIFVAKYDSSGNVLWADSYGGNFYDRANSISVDSHSNIYFVGTYASESISFGGYSLINDDSSGNGHNGFIVKCDSSGNVLSAIEAGTFNNLNSCTIDLNDNLYITGDFWQQTISFANITLTNTFNYPNHDLYLVKYDSSGSIVWGRKAGGTCNVVGKNLITDYAGNIFIAGFSCSPSITFDNLVIRMQPPGAGSDGFVVKYDANGNALWAKNEGGNSSDNCEGIGVDGIGNCYVTGSFKSDSLNLDNITLINSFDTLRTSDMFVAKIGFTTGIVEEKYMPNTLSVFPNPAYEDVQLYFGSVFNGTISVIDNTGKIVLHKNVKLLDNLIIDLSQLNNGFYFIKAEEKNALVRYSKLVVSR